MKTKTWVKFSLMVLLVWNIVLTYRYYKEHKALNIAERTIYKHFDPELRLEDMEEGDKGSQALSSSTFQLNQFLS